MSEQRLRAEAAVWLIRLDSGRIDRDDAALARWCARSTAHRRAFDAATHGWQQAGSPFARPEAATMAAAPVQSTAPVQSAPATTPQQQSRVGKRGWQMSATGQPSPRRPAFHRLRLSRPFGVPAVAFAVLALVSAGTLWTAWRPDVASGTGEIRTLTLADGSVARVDAQSAIDVDFTGDIRRIVLRRGRAAFDVRHGDRRPFVVVAGNGTVTDLGTAFQVDLRPSDRSGTDTGSQAAAHALAEVVVTQGRVRLNASHTGSVMPAADGLTLAAGEGGEFVPSVRHGSEAATNTPDAEAASVLPRRLSLDANAFDEATAWQRGRLRIDNAPLADVVRALNRYYPGHRIFVTGAAGTERVSGNFALGDPAAALATLVEVMHLQRAEFAGRLIFLSDPPHA